MNVMANKIMLCGRFVVLLLENVANLAIKRRFINYNLDFRAHLRQAQQLRFEPIVFVWKNRSSNLIFQTEIQLMKRANRIICFSL